MRLPVYPNNSKPAVSYVLPAFVQSGLLQCILVSQAFIQPMRMRIVSHKQKKALSLSRYKEKN